MRKKVSAKWESEVSTGEVPQAKSDTGEKCQRMRRDVNHVFLAQAHAHPLRPSRFNRFVPVPLSL